MKNGKQEDTQNRNETTTRAIRETQTGMLHAVRALQRMTGKVSALVE